MTLRDVLARTSFSLKAEATGTDGGDVTGISYDSRHLTRGAVFFALRGVNADGARFAPQAIAGGAMAVVAETAAPAGVAVPWIQVPNARAALAEFAAAFYRNPSEELALVGITGTNGKTTTSYVLASIFESAGIKCGRIGTIGHRVGAREVDAARTTPEAPELQTMLRDMVTAGCGACVMEVSSHALALRRADELRFAAGIFRSGGLGDVSDVRQRVLDTRNRDYDHRLDVLGQQLAPGRNEQRGCRGHGKHGLG